MSSLHLPRTPAWSALLPVQPRFAPAPLHLQRLICNALGPGRLLKRVPVTSTPEGYYRFEPNRGEVLFLKVLGSERADHQIRANDIAHYLSGRGLEVSSLLHGFPLTIDGQWMLLGFRYAPSRFVRPDPTELPAIGKLLGRLHGMLAEAPFSAEVALEAHHREEALEVVRQDIVRQRMCAGPEPNLIHRRLAAGPLTFIEQERQVVHGDFNFGNVLWNLVSRRPMVLDFEDTLIAFHPPQFDLAMAIERFVLPWKCDLSEKVRLGSGLWRGYVQAAGQIPCLEHGWLVRALRILNRRALTVLALLEMQGKSIPLTEWRKFLALYSATEENPVLWENLERALDEASH